MEKKVKKRPRGGREKKKIVAEKCNKKKLGYFRISVALFDWKKKKKKKKTHSA